MSMIYGEQVRLRAVERDDVKHYYAWVNDPEVTHGLSLYLPMSNADEEQWYERAMQRDANEKPLAIEVMTLLLRHCFETLNLNRVFLRVYADNPRAVRAYAKAGFIEEGRMREAVFKRGKYDDVILMSVLRSDWKAGPSGQPGQGIKENQN